MPGVCWSCSSSLHFKTSNPSAEQMFLSTTWLCHNVQACILLSSKQFRESAVWPATKVKVLWRLAGWPAAEAEEPLGHQGLPEHL